VTQKTLGSLAALSALQDMAGMRGISNHIINYFKNFILP
jgi:hypothetical protein